MNDMDIEFRLGKVDQILANLQRQCEAQEVIVKHADHLVDTVNIKHDNIMAELKELKETLKNMDSKDREQDLLLQKMNSTLKVHDKWIEKHEILHNDESKTKSNRNWQMWVIIISLGLSTAVGWVMALLK